MRILPALTLATLAIAGCGGPEGAIVTNSDGDRMSTNGKGDVRVTDKDGNTVDMKKSGDGFESKSSTGGEVKVDRKGRTATQEKGEKLGVGVATVSEADLGLPFYPGSQPVVNLDSKMESGKDVTYTSFRSTSDEPERVAEFYKGKLTKPTTMGNEHTVGSERMRCVVGNLVDGRHVTIWATLADGKTTIQVTVMPGK